MIFFGNLIYSLICAYCIDRIIKQHNGISDWALLLLLFPIFIIWLIICGGQDHVGTDYPSYMEIFNGYIEDRYANSGELGFVTLVKFLNILGFKGQALFFFIYSINFIFFYLLLKRIDSQYFIYILLYIVVTGLFNNQLNILRQATAIYIGTYATILILEGNGLKGLLFIILASSFHISSVVLLVVYFYKIFAMITPFWLNKCVYICFILGIFLGADFLVLFMPFLPENYTWHIQSGAVEQRSFIIQLTKFIYIPLYLLAISKYGKYRLSCVEKYLFHLGIISFCLRLLLVNLTIVSRIGDAFILISIYPLYTYMNYLYKNNKYILFLGITCSITFMYFVKTIILPVGEYLYQSIYY